MFAKRSRVFLMMLTTLVSVMGTSVFALEPAESFTLTDLTRLMASNHVSKIETLIPLLPSGLRRNSTFITQSESMQSATPLSPRVVLWNERGGFAMTFNGGLHGQDGSSVLEVLQADQQNKLHFYKIAFPLGTVSEPKSCLQCHGTDPRPIWKEYPTWKDSYGSQDDFTPIEQSGDFEKFIQGAHTQARYQSLFSADVKTEDYSSYPYRGDHLARSTDLFTAFNYRPNLRLGEFLTRLNARRLAAIIQVHPLSRGRRSRLIYELMNCGQSTLPKEITPIVKSFGLKTADFDLRHTYDSNETHDLDFGVSYFDGSATIIEYLLGQLISNDHDVTLRGLDQKYALDNPRNNIDRSWFQVMDQLSLWLPLPYHATELTIQIQKREPYIMPYRIQYERICEKFKE